MVTVLCVYTNDDNESRNDMTNATNQSGTSIGKPAVKLQGVGLVFSRLASDLKVGDVVMFNGGVKRTVIAVQETSSKMLLVSYAVPKSVFFADGIATQKIAKSKQMASSTALA